MQGDGHSKEESKGNAGNNNKNCSRNERFDGLINTLDTAKERINELEEIQIQLSKLKCKKKKDTTEYLK